MRRVSRALLLIASLCAVEAAASTEQEALVDAKKLNLRDDAYMAGWFVNPTPLAGPAVLIRRYQPILATKMFPYRAYAVQDLLAVKSPSYTAPAGTELVGVIAHVPIACTPKHVAQTATQKLILRTGSVHLCFVDTNNDGSFDLNFATKAGIWSGVIPTTATKMEPVKFRSIEPKTSTLVTNLWLHLRYAKNRSLHVGYLQDEKDRTKDGLVSVLPKEDIFYDIKVKSLPFSVKFFGTEYQIEEIGDQVAKFSILSQKSIAPVYIGTSCCR